MIKYFFFLLSFLIISQIVSSQKPELIITGNGKELHLEHKVAAKESFFSVGRLYNVHPRHLASYNKLDFSKGLSINQKLWIPLTDTNFTQKVNTGTPIYYKTVQNEELIEVSKANKNVELEYLRAWNNLSGNNTGDYNKLIVGFLKSKEMPSGAIADKPIEKIEEKTKVVEKEIVEKKADEQRQPVVTEQTIIKTPENPELSGIGFFKSYFERQIKSNPVTKSETVTSGIFKTTSGWNDAKYYMLIDKVEPGTIIRVINPENNKVVFTKVLGEMNGIHQNEGLDIRLSNAAAEALGIKEQDKYIVKINY